MAGRDVEQQGGVVQPSGYGPRFVSQLPTTLVLVGEVQLERKRGEQASSKPFVLRSDPLERLFD